MKSMFTVKEKKDYIMCRPRFACRPHISTRFSIEVLFVEMRHWPCQAMQLFDFVSRSVNVECCLSRFSAKAAQGHTHKKRRHAWND